MLSQSDSVSEFILIKRISKSKIKHFLSFLSIIEYPVYTGRKTAKGLPKSSRLVGWQANIMCGYHRTNSIHRDKSMLNFLSSPQQRWMVERGGEGRKTGGLGGG